MEQPEDLLSFDEIDKRKITIRIEADGKVLFETFKDATAYQAFSYEYLTTRRRILEHTLLRTYKSLQHIKKSSNESIIDDSFAKLKKASLIQRILKCVGIK